MNRKKKAPVTNIGMVTLLMIFIVLCLVIFAALVLSDALNSRRYSDQLAAHTTAYYEASGRAQRRLAEVDAELCRLAKDTKDDEEYKERVLAYFDESKYVIEGMCVTFSEKMNDTQAIEVSLLIAPERTAEKRYQITAYTERRISEWKGGDMGLISEESEP